LGIEEGRSYVFSLQGDMRLVKMRLPVFAAILILTSIGMAFGADEMKLAMSFAGGGPGGPDQGGGMGAMEAVRSRMR
jgi:hypothetical protein